MIGFGICLLVLVPFVPGRAVLWAGGILSLLAGAGLHMSRVRGRTGTGGRHPH